MEIRPIGGALGAEIRGVDLDRVTDADIEAIRAAILDHLAVFFPGQRLTPAGHRRLGAGLGEIVANHYNPQVDPDLPGVTVHRSVDGYVADVWHSDGQPRQAPVAFTILKMVQMPSRGGDTMFSNQYRVYDRLSAPLKELLDGLTAVQRSLINPNEGATHRAVVVHPVTGRKLLYVSKAHTTRFVELSQRESRALIDHLVEESLTPENTYRYHWTPGDVGIWDNLAVLHYGVADFDEPRMFHRVMVQGPELPTGVDRWPAVDDATPRTVLRKDGTAGVVGQMDEQLWVERSR